MTLSLILPLAAADFPSLWLLMGGAAGLLLLFVLLYLTTRFHPAPKGLLDVTNDFANDPTHITAMNKDFLRVLFLIEGLRSRPDLEERMDWKKFGRVMVFQKG